MSGFEETVTKEMIVDHFSNDSNFKSVVALKLPMNKLGENKGYAFIYFKTADDARLVKQKYDRTAILKKQIRVTMIVISENLSKMILKLKTRDEMGVPYSKEKIEQLQEKFFGEEYLEEKIQELID